MAGFCFCFLGVTSFLAGFERGFDWFSRLRGARLVFRVLGGKLTGFNMIWPVGLVFCL